MKKIFTLAACLLVTACGGVPEKEVVFLEQDARVENFAAECKSKNDPKWTKLPDAAISKADLARNYRKNETSFTELSGKRAVCNADILARQKKG